MTTNETSPEPKSRASSTPPSDESQLTGKHRHELSRLRHAWRRRVWLACGCCTESCRCQHKGNPTPLRVDGYLAAVEHLHKHGLPAALLTPEARQLWKRGGSDRAVADRVVRRWTA